MEKITIVSMEVGNNVAGRIVEMLNGKVFTVVSYHSAYVNSPTILQNFTLKRLKPLVKGTLFKIVLYPRRSLAFDVSESPTVVFEDDKRIKIIRKLGRDTVTREILINL